MTLTGRLGGLLAPGEVRPRPVEPLVDLDAENLIGQGQLGGPLEDPGLPGSRAPLSARPPIFTRPETSRMIARPSGSGQV